MELQKLGRKAFPTSGTKEFDRIAKGRFYPALLPKWQRKLGAPKATETFEELYARARTLECHEQQFGASRGETRQTEQCASRNAERSTSQESKQKNHPRNEAPKGSNLKSNQGRTMPRYLGKQRGCFNCEDLNHFQRNCPKLKSEAAGRSGRVSNLSAKENGAEGVKVSEESCSPATESYTPEEKS